MIATDNKRTLRNFQYSARAWNRQALAVIAKYSLPHAQYIGRLELLFKFKRLSFSTDRVKGDNTDSRWQERYQHMLGSSFSCLINRTDRKPLASLLTLKVGRLQKRAADVVEGGDKTVNFCE